MHGKTDEIDVVMAIENIGHQLKQIKRDNNSLLQDIAGSLELIALALQGVYK